jgi:hypothetical protein
MYNDPVETPSLQQEPRKSYTPFIPRLDIKNSIHKKHVDLQRA